MNSWGGVEDVGDGVRSSFEDLRGGGLCRVL